MKKLLLLSVLAASVAMSATAQDALVPEGRNNWSIGLDAGVTTPMKGYAFFGSLRPVVGLHVDKQVSPVFKVGVEGLFGINTSTVRGPQSSTAFDNSYVGVYGAANLFNLFGGYDCRRRPFDMEAVLGAGWGHNFETRIKDQNYFATKVGLNFNFNVSKYVTINITPGITWNMTGEPVEQSTASYNIMRADFSLMAGVSYHIGGGGFACVEPRNQAEIDALNSQINDLRGQVQTKAEENADLAARNAKLASDLDKCLNAAPKVVTKTDNKLTSVRYIFFRIGSSTITADQQPNVEMIAAYLNSHPQSKVVIKGYASKDGPEDVNIRLANSRAASVKDALQKRYKIPASRIVAEGEGIGEMFEEESWNRVAICFLEDK